MSVAFGVFLGGLSKRTYLVHSALLAGLFLFVYAASHADIRTGESINILSVIPLLLAVAPSRKIEDEIARSASENDEPGLLSRGKVLLISPQPFFLTRGTPLNVRALANGLVRIGYQVDLLAYPIGEDIVLPGVTIYRSLGFPGIRKVAIGPSWKKVILDFLLMLKAVRLCFSNRYVVIHGIEEGGIIATLLGLVRRTPAIFDMDSLMSEQLATSRFIRSKMALRAVTQLESFFLRRASGILTVCAALTDYAKSVAPAIPLAQIEDFPVTGAENPDELLIRSLRNEFNLGEHSVLLYTGNLERYQGIDLLLESVAVAVARAAQATSREEFPILVIVGGEASQIAAYREKTQSLGIAELVRFAGKRPEAQMVQFMALADVLMSPRTEGFNTPLKVYSYMASGKPIVATKILSHTQVLNDESAYLSEPTVDSYATALLAALDRTAENLRRRASRAAAARALIDNVYNEANFERRLALFYAQIVPQSFHSTDLALSRPAFGASRAGTKRA